MPRPNRMYYWTVTMVSCKAIYCSYWPANQKKNLISIDSIKEFEKYSN